jgi:hypothetical protein
LVGEGTAQTSGDGGSSGNGGISIGALVNALISALETFLRTLFAPVTDLIETHGNSLLRLIVETPAPTRVFQTPTTLPWPTLHRFYWTTMIPLALLLFGLAIGIVILLETTSTLFSSYHRANLKRRSISGLFGVLSWWWLAAASLQLADHLAMLLLPDLSTLTLFQTVSFGGIGLLGVLVSLSVDLGVFVLLALVYLTRRLALYGFVLGMPLLIVAWIPGVGPFRLLSRVAKRLAGFYVPFLVMPLPTALLLRLAALLGDAAELSMGGIGAWLTAMVIPFVALVVPFVLFWQAGAVLFIGDRLGRQASRRRLQTRLEHGREQGVALANEGRNALRGVRGQRAIGRDGQTELRSGVTRSRSHRLGGRLRRATRRLGGSPAHSDGRQDQSPVQFDQDRFEPTDFDRTENEPILFEQESGPTDNRSPQSSDRTDE